MEPNPEQKPKSFLITLNTGFWTQSPVEKENKIIGIYGLPATKNQSGNIVQETFIVGQGNIITHKRITFEAGKPREEILDATSVLFFKQIKEGQTEKDGSKKPDIFTYLEIPPQEPSAKPTITINEN